MNTIENILGTVNSAKANLDKVENSLFTVYKTPSPSFEYTAPDGKKVTVSESDEEFRVFTCKGKNLGTMRGQFEPMQPKELFDNIISTVHEFGADLDLSTLKFRTFSNSKKIEFSIALKPFTFINNKKVLDETNLFVTFSTSYDGSKSNTIALYTQRVVCTNGMVANKLQGTLKGRNIISGKAKILSYASELADIINGATEFKQKMEALDKIKLNRTQLEQFKITLFTFNKAELLDKEDKAKALDLKEGADEKKNLTKAKQKNGRSHGILDGFELARFNTHIEFDFATKELLNEYKNSPEFKTDFETFKAKDFVSMTAFEVLQSVTHYTNHIAKIKSDTNENLRFGSGFDLNSKAQEILFELVEA
jgi:hypothetical protein